MFGLLGKLWNYEEKAEKLYKNRRWQTHYKGYPTKRYRKYVRYYNMSNVGAERWLSLYK